MISVWCLFAYLIVEVVASAYLEVGFGLIVDVVVELLDVELGIGERTTLDLAHLGAHLVVDVLELFGCGHVVLNEALGEGGDRIALLAHLLDLLALAIARARIAHAVARVAIGDHLEHNRSVLEHIVAREACGLAHAKHVHAVDAYARHVVAARVELGAGRAAVDAGAHGVAVVLAHEYARQVPQLGHVVGLEHLALVGRAVAVQRHAHVLLARVLVLERDASAERHLGAHDAIAAVEVLAVHVHGAALAVGAAALAARQLGEHAKQRHAHHVRPAVSAIRRDHRVVVVQRRLHANANGFLLFFVVFVLL